MHPQIVCVRLSECLIFPKGACLQLLFDVGLTSCFYDQCFPSAVRLISSRRVCVCLSQCIAFSKQNTNSSVDSLMGQLVGGLAGQVGVQGKQLSSAAHCRIYQQTKRRLGLLCGS